MGEDEGKTTIDRAKSSLPRQSLDDDFDSLAILLASGELDALETSIRKATVREATSIIITSLTARRELAGGLGLRAASECRSNHAYHRICQLLTRALIVNCRELGGGEGGKDREKQRDDVSNGLADALCHLLIRKAATVESSRHGYSKQTIGGTFHWSSNGGVDTNGKKIRTEKCLIRVCSRELEVLAKKRPIGQTWESTGAALPIVRAVNAFLSVARANPTAASRGRYAPALACIHHLKFTVATMELREVLMYDDIRKEMMDILVKRFFGVPNKFASKAEVSCVDALVSSMTQEEFDSLLAPTMGVKLRANPESAIGTVAEILHVIELSAVSQRLRAGGDRASVSGGHGGEGFVSCNSISLSSHLEGETKFLPAAVRQLRSTKEVMRRYASMMLVSLVAVSPSDTAGIVLNAIAETLKGKGGATTALASPDQRIDVYFALEGHATVLVDGMASGGEAEIVLALKCADVVLGPLCSSASRESSEAAKHAAYDAIASWLAVAMDARFTSSTGFREAITFLSSPLVGKSNTSKEFRMRMGAVVTNRLIRQKQLEERIVGHVFDADGKVAQGLKSIIDSAVKKHGGAGGVGDSSGFKVGSTVPQLDGVLAIYVFLLKASILKKTTADAVANKSLPAFVGKVLQSPSSFLYCRSLTDTCPDPLVQLVPKSIEIYLDVHDSKNYIDLFSRGGGSAGSGAARALAACSINPFNHELRMQSHACLENILSNVTSSPAAQFCFSAVVDMVIIELYNEINDRSVEIENQLRDLQARKEDREAIQPIQEDPTVKVSVGRLFDERSARNCANVLSKYVASHFAEYDGEYVPLALVLTHVGCTSNSSRLQRQALTKHSARILTTMLSRNLDEGTSSGKSRVVSAEWPTLNLGRFAEVISSCACSGDESATSCTREASEKTADKNDTFEAAPSGGSLAVHNAACGLVVSLCQLAANFDVEFDDPEDDDSRPYYVARCIVTNELPSFLVKHIQCDTVALQSLMEEDMDLYQSREGELFRTGDSGAPDGTVTEHVLGKSGNAAKKRTTKGRKHKGDFGASFAEEEWEREMKKELAEKRKREELQKNASTPTRRLLSTEEKSLLEKQGQKRTEMRRVLDGGFLRSLIAISSVCKGDIMVGNECLPAFSSSVISAGICDCPAIEALPRLRARALDTLRSLAMCVYEIEEDYAHDVACALAICFRSFSSRTSGTSDANTGAKEGTTRIGSNQKDPVLLGLPSPCPCAAVTISQMDEYGDSFCGSSFSFLFPILRAALAGPRTIPGCNAALRVLDRHTELLREGDPIVCSLRRDMVLCILELLSHDRSQTFHDPNPYEALVKLFEIENLKPSISDMSPLLGDCGALGCKNCRVASMMALSSIASHHLSVVKGNPLIENRIWVNCFDKDLTVRSAARAAWHTLNLVEVDADDAQLAPPSKIYAVPLLSLLSHEDVGISSAAAAAFACAMGMHPDTVGSGLERLCSAYIDAYPTVSEERLQPKKIAAVKPTGVPSKKSTKLGTKPMASARIGTVKKTGKQVKTKATRQIQAKQIMTKEQLENQFFAASSRKDGHEKDNEEKTKIRLGVLSAITSLAEPSAEVDLDIVNLQVLVVFLMAYANADMNERVCSVARNSVKDIVARYGGSDEAISFLIPFIEGVLSSGKVGEINLASSLPTDKIPKSISASDRRKEGAVVALGSVALYLKGDLNLDKIDSTIDMLIDTLRTPSEDVQASVAASLSKLMKKGRTPERVEQILADLMKDCIYGSSLAVRRGAAYGVSAVVKGSGIACLKKYDIVKRLEESCTSGPPNGREGALFAIELLCSRLGLLFEPYVIVLLPALLKTFSDSNDYVRSAANNTASLIMSKLSAHGVKLVLPAVLSTFDETEWRTKQASIHMLGSMCHCAPKQLASALPKVVPKVVEAFSDTHPKVKASAEQSLNEISKVIRNPEISSLSPILVSALTDPANETKNALEALIETEFLHAIDAPSLALIVPVLYRGLRDRGAASKRYSALIAGNMCSMISDPRDFSPYLPVLLPSLKTVLLDPIPDVRSTAAKALGSLTRGLGEDALPDLRPWLIDTLKGELGSSVERSGAAQGLTEVLIAGGPSVVETVVTEEIIQLRSHPKASTREGVLWVFTFLPASYGQAFAPLIDVSLPVLLSGLSDESEPVREVAMRAGRVLIRSHGRAHVDKVLPSLENGLSDDDWRIRYSSLTLLGDLLSMIGGAKGVVKGDGDTQEDVRQAERAQAQIAMVLGTETRKRILSRLYLARSDTVAAVRQIALQVWKTVVSVTGRTLRDVLHALVEQIVNYLASGNTEQTEVAGRCLGDIVNKLGESVLPEIIPVLRDALYRGDENTRRGACVGLAEVIACSSKDHINKFLVIIVKAVQDALCDEDEGVRKMAAGCFQSLYNVVGLRAFDEVVPVLLAAMRDGDEGENEASRARALHGLTGILSIRSRELLPYLLPRILQRPITTSHANALGSISEVTGGTIHTHFHSIVPAFISELTTSSVNESEEEKEREIAIRACVQRISYNVETEGVNVLVSEISSRTTSDKHLWRKESCWMLGIVCEERKEKKDFYDQVPIMLRDLLYRLNDSEQEVLIATNSALTSITKNIPAEELVSHLDFCRNLLASIVSDARRRKGGVGDGEFLLPGFNMRKGGLEPLLPIYQRGILYGNSSTREVAAAGLGELISLTDSKFLASNFIIKMTGPLLRIVGDRNPSPVKIAIIQTLSLILKKGGPALRAFVPQFQTTFVKALSDPSRQVRIEATKALALLMPLSMRVDPLIKELVSGSLGTSVSPTVDAGSTVAVQTATLDALATVLKYGGKKAKLSDSIPSAMEAGKELLFHGNEGVREGAAKVMGSACELLGVEVATLVLNEKVTTHFEASEEAQHGQANVCYRILASAVGRDLNDEVFMVVTERIKLLMSKENTMVKEAACVAVGALLGSSKNTLLTLKDVESCILTCMGSAQSMEVHKGLAKGLCIAVLMKPCAFRGVPGLSIMDGAVKLAMSGNQRVQLAFNDFLWLALGVADGQEGLNDYVSIANFENTKTVKTLMTKVLSRIKAVDTEDF